eukprot:c639_g1_i1.p1 GENE.c639_g1_i1~~c639_g1_i1.p1  ORF type:complete len:733 (+),score=215.29 c639_g1_i1:60-2258(+)
MSDCPRVEIAATHTVVDNRQPSEHAQPQEILGRSPIRRASSRSLRSRTSNASIRNSRDEPTTPRTRTAAMRARRQHMELKKVQVLEVVMKMMDEVTDTYTRDTEAITSNKGEAPDVVAILGSNLQIQQSVVDKRQNLIEELRKKLLELQTNVTQLERERTELTQFLDDVENDKEVLEEELASIELLLTVGEDLQDTNSNSDKSDSDFAVPEPRKTRGKNGAHPLQKMTRVSQIDRVLGSLVRGEHMFDGADDNDDHQPSGHTDAHANVHADAGSDAGDDQGDQDVSQARVDEIRLILEDLAAEMEDGQRAIDETDQAISELRKEIAEVTKQFDQAIEDLKDANRMFDEAWTTVQSAHTEAEKAREEEWMHQRAVAGKVSERLSHFAKLKSTAMEEIAQMFEGLTMITPNYIKLVSAAKMLRRELHHVKYSAEENMRAMTSMIDLDRTRSIAMINIVQKSWQRRIEHLEAKLQERQTLIDEVNSRNGALELRNKYLEAENKAGQDSLKKVEAEKKRNAELIEELTAAQKQNASFQAKISVLQTKLQSAEASAEAGAQRMNELERGIANSDHVARSLALSSDVAQEAKSMLRATAALDQLRKSHATTERNLKEEILRLSSALETERRLKEDALNQIRISGTKSATTSHSSKVSFAVPAAKPSTPSDIAPDSPKLRAVIEESKKIYQMAISAVEPDMQRSNDSEKILMREVVELKSKVAMLEETIKQHEAEIQHK